MNGVAKGPLGRSLNKVSALPRALLRAEGGWAEEKQQWREELA